MQTVSPKTLKDTMFYHTIPVFKYKICYPCFTTTYSIAAARNVSSYYSLDARKTEEHCRTALFAQAADNARYIPSSQPPFNSYEFDSLYQITYNLDCITSLYTDQYEYMGGAHGATTRSSDTWNFKTCARLSLQQFYPYKSDFPENILVEIESQISKRLVQSPSSYFDDYASLLRKNFNPNSFYLNSSGLVIYYQQYDIAPYSTGIPTFCIPIKENFPACF